MALPKLIVILGTTACGKSGLGVELARAVGGEIVSADSRQVYRGLDLGTGKVTAEEMDGVPRHLLDVVSPNQSYSVAEFRAGRLRRHRRHPGPGEDPPPGGGHRALCPGGGRGVCLSGEPAQPRAPGRAGGQEHRGALCHVPRPDRAHPLGRRG